MADKMMRIAGRNYDGGKAVAIRANEFGSLSTFANSRREQLIDQQIVLEPNQQIDFYVDFLPLINIIGNIVESSVDGISIGFQDAIGTSSQAIELEKVYVNNSIFKTSQYLTKSYRTRIRVKNENNESITLNNMYAISNPIIEEKKEILKVIEILDYTHADFFEYDNDGNAVSTKPYKIKSINTHEYKDLMVYIDCSYEVPFDIYCYERYDNVYRTSDFDGEKFTGESINYIEIPETSTNGASTTVRYPIHSAIKLFENRIYTLQIRVRAKEVQTRKKHSNGSDYIFKIIVMGVKA